MRAHFVFSTLTVLMFYCLWGYAAGEGSRCGGGDLGPKPLADISGDFKADVSEVPTVGGPQEFLFSERSNSIVYRNDQNGIFKTTENFTSSKQLTTSAFPLSRVFDPLERYLSAESAPSVFDRRTNRWYSYQMDARPYRNVFWNKDKLYSVASRIDGKNNQYISIYEYRVGDGAAYKVCKTLTAPQGKHFILAEGHDYPNIYFYRTQKGPDGLLISVYRMNVGFGCKVSGIGEYTREIAGPVKSVHVFKELKGLAVEVDHPTHNLLWDSKAGPHAGCRYLNIGKAKPLVLNYSLPVIATWSLEKGLSFVYLDDETEAHVTTPDRSPFSEIAAGDVWMANDASRVFLSPRYEVDGQKSLLKLTLGANH